MWRRISRPYRTSIIDLLKLPTFPVTKSVTYAAASSRVLFPRPAPNGPFSHRLYINKALTANLQHIMIVVAEDHDDTRHLLMVLLKKLGHPVRLVSDGAAALAMAKEKKPSVCIFDQEMPGMTGLEVFAAMRADDQLKDVPVVFYSADSRDDIRQQALSLGAVDWVIKGVHGTDRLLAVVGRALRPE